MTGTGPQRRAVGALGALGALYLAGLAGCAGPGRTPDRGRDGPGANPPPSLDRVPDARPRVEPLRVGGPNKPYEIFGQRYVPMTTDVAFRESGGRPPLRHGAGTRG